MCPCAAIRRVGRGDDSGLLPGVDGWEQAHQPVRHREELSSEPAGLSVQGKRTEYPWPAPRTWRRSPAMRAGIARPRCVRGLRGVSPQDDLPKASRAWGCPPPSPGGGPRSPVHTSVCTLTNRAGSARRASLRRDPGPGTRHTGRVYVRSPYFPDFMSARAVANGCVLHRNCLHRHQRCTSRTRVGHGE